MSEATIKLHLGCRPKEIPGFVHVDALDYPHFGACARLYAASEIDDLEMIRGLICGGQKDEYDYHKIIFDEQSLSTALRETGFRETRLWDWRETEHAAMDDFSQACIPHMEKSQAHSSRSIWKR